MIRYLDEFLYEDELSTVADLAIYLCVSRRTITNRCQNDEKFTEFFKLLKIRQEQALWNKALARKRHPGMAQFALTNFGHAKLPSKIRQGMNHDN